MGGLLIIFVLAIVVAMSAASYLFTPHGPNQTWAITYLAQLHPLLQPRHSKIRPHNPVDHSL
ncbi:hypothetical protein BG011_009919 [Mortierella polycephala]|uniref:Uncharacterized protein n=1 Tax=Mortierella polycephala TaxID=41804 RepID=A0A9P6TWB9_9FUNG|nr:hypothetical protein BG011_009919 [Mortierella polycephala]